MASKLCIFTNTFPAKKAGPFLIRELPYLLEHFDRIYLIPAAETDSSTWFELPEQVEVVNLVSEYRSSSLSRWWRYIISLPSVLTRVKEERKRSKVPGAKLRQQALYLHLWARQLCDFISDRQLPSDTPLYSYWAADWAVVLGLVKKNGWHSGRAVTRLHGFDLFEERASTGTINFHPFKLKYLDALCPISQNGVDYLYERYPFCKSRIKMYRLGIPFNGLSLNPDSIEETFNIVSCSGVIPLKRVTLIAEALRYVTQHVKWVHFGDGTEMDKVRNLATELPANISVELPGFTQVEAIYEHYQNQPVDLFINVSTTEGIPFSIIEAAAHGIPVLATNVGGTAEIVVDEVGELVEADINPSRLAARITEHLENGPVRSGMIIQAVCRSRFDAAVNYPDFIKEVLLQS